MPHQLTTTERKRKHKLLPWTLGGSLIKNKKGKNIPILQIKKSTLRNSGKGLFTNVSIKKDTCITKYDGHFISYKQALELSEKGKGTHLFKLKNSTQWLDGNFNAKHKKYKGFGLASFCNDSTVVPKKNKEGYIEWKTFKSPSLVPNAYFRETRRKITTKKNTQTKNKTQIFLFSTKNILAGSEIFAKYGHYYWKVTNHNERANYFNKRNF